MSSDSTERGVISVTPVNIDPRGRSEKKCNSQPFLSNNYGKVQSRYLGSPVGSCHDLCKYGRKHELGIEKLLTFKKFMANGLTSDAVQCQKGPSACEQREKSGFKMESSGKTKEQNMQQEGKIAGMPKNHVRNNISSSPPKREISKFSAILGVTKASETHGMLVGKEMMFEKMIDLKTSNIHESKGSSKEVEDDNISQSLLEVLVPEKSTEVSPQMILTHSLESEINKRKVLNASKKKKQQTIESEVLPAHESFAIKLNIIKDEDLPESPSTFKEKVASYMKETISSSASKGISQKKASASKLSASPCLRRMKHNVSLPYRRVNGYAEPAISLKMRDQSERGIPQVDAHMNQNSQGKWEKVTRRFEKPKDFGERKLWGLQNAYISSIMPASSGVNTVAEKYRNINLAMQDGDANLLEDCGHSHDNSSEAVEDNSDKQVKFNSFSVGDVCDFSKIEEMQTKQFNGSSKEEKGTARRTPAAQMDDNYSSPYKLKFKRGRRIELMPLEKVGAVRLRFRRGRVLGEKSNDEVMKRIFRTAMSDSGDPRVEIHAMTLKGTKPSEAKNLTLKHLDAQEKKDMQALFNHVIEETASKLVETSKSKVKALVGAFETVISLQETVTAALVVLAFNQTGME